MLWGVITARTALPCARPTALAYQMRTHACRWDLVGIVTYRPKVNMAISVLIACALEHNLHFLAFCKRRCKYKLEGRACSKLVYFDLQATDTDCYDLDIWYICVLACIQMSHYVLSLWLTHLLLWLVAFKESKRISPWRHRGEKSFLNWTFIVIIVKFIFLM